MKKLLLAFALLLPGIASAATLAIKDGNGNAATLGEASDTSGNLYPIQVIGNIVSGSIVTAPVSATNGLTVNLGTFALPTGANVIGGVTQSGTWTNTVTQATGTNLHMVCDSGCSSSSAPADQSSFSAGITSQSPVGGFFQTTATSNPLTSGQMGAFQVTANRALFINLRNSSGTEIGNASNPVQVSLANTGANGTVIGVNEAQINGVTPLMGNGVSGTGSQRVNIASDNSPIGVSTSAVISNPTSTLTLPATTTAYTAGQLIANSATAGSVVVPSFGIANSAGGAIIPRLRLTSNDATSTAWGGQTIVVDLWTTAPTWSNGDRGAWSPATNTSKHIGAYTCVMSSEYGSGVFSECYPNVGNATTVDLASGTSIFWSLNAITGSGVTGASKVFTLTAELLN
jgi:hypothetical protein